jgi:V-type H+-transporting ATPase subunit H
LTRVAQLSWAQHWDDSDIADLLGWMEEHLQEGIATLSSFERYRKELLTGQLTWAPMHESGAAALSSMLPWLLG